MSNSPQSTSYHSYSSTDMEGPGHPGEVLTPPHSSETGIAPAHQFLYLKVKGSYGINLSPALFAKDVIAGMFITQHMVGPTPRVRPEAPLNVMVLSECEAVLELSESADLESHIISLAAVEWWVGQKVVTESRVATHEEISEAKRKTEEEEWHHENPNEEMQAEVRFVKMMEDIHKLAVNPHGDALRISTFSGVVPPPKNEASFSQWVHEVRDALGRFPEPTVRNWITRSLRGAPAELVRGLGPNPAVETVIKKMHSMHGAVAPLDVMMRRLFNISQNKGEQISSFATRLETAINSIQHDHPGQLTQATIQNSLRDWFYQGLKKSLKESLRYLYAAKVTYEEILTAARAAEAESEDYKEVGGATSKAVQAPHPEVMEQLASIQAVVKKAWNAQQNSQQKQRKQGDGKKDNNNNPSGKKKRSDTCYGCGGMGHFIKDCPNPHKSSLNSKRGGKKPKAPPATTKKETGTSSPAEDTSPEEEQAPEDGPEQV